ncbi:MAG: hypothetical protein DRO00_05130 [Thermoproteota archaeon]|nr:MAG: hypothetical protein DRO00_05130 [Candidatus Korarchaeota archaeon]
MNIEVSIDPDWGEPCIEYHFTPESFDPEEVKRAFLATKYAYKGAIKELESKGIVVRDEIWGFVLTLLEK